MATSVESTHMEGTDQSGAPDLDDSLADADRPSTLRAPGYRCARCGDPVPWSVAKFCRDQRDRFGGRLYCRSCQAAFPPA
jgi:hypothetical protein